MKLTDTQLVILSAASQREDRAVEPPPNVKGAAAQKAIGKLLSGGLVEEIPARGALPVWRKDEQQGGLALRITQRGIEAIGVTETGPASGKPDPEASRATLAAKKIKPARTSRPRRAASKEPLTRHNAGASKQDRVIQMLRRPEGATVPVIMKVTGWQQHSVRGFFAGVVRKKLSLPLVSETTDRGRTYRIRTGKAPKRAAKAKRPA